MQKKSSSRQASVSGWLQKRSRFLGRAKNFWFELDEFTEYVSYYTNDPKLGPSFSKAVGYFCLEGGSIDVDNKDSCKMRVKTGKGRKYTLVAPSEGDCKRWMDAMTRAKDVGETTEQLASMWKGTECEECMQVVVNEEAQDEEENTIEEMPSVWDVPVKDRNGRMVQFGTLLTAPATVIILLRHFGCMLCRHAAGKVCALTPFFDRMGVNLIAVGCGTPAMAKRFREEFNFAGEIYVDQARQLYKSLNCRRGIKYNLTRKTLAASREAMKAGYKQGPNQGDVLQLGGVFVVTKQLDLIFQHVEQWAGHHADLNVLTAALTEWYGSHDTWTTQPREVIQLPNCSEMPLDWPLDAGLHYRFEKPRENAVFENLILDDGLASGVAYESEFVTPKLPHVLLVGENELFGPVAIAVELTNGEYDAKCIVWSKQGRLKVLVPKANAESVYTSVYYLYNFTPVADPNLLYAPMLNTSGLKKCRLNIVDSPQLPLDLCAYERKESVHNFKFGLLWIKPNQDNEDQWYSNGHAQDPFSDPFSYFLESIGERRRAQVEGYRGGLPPNTESYFSSFKNNNIVYHVAPMLLYQPDDAQRVERKRHVGNDVVVVVFLEQGARFAPEAIRSHFNHVFIVVQEQPIEAKVEKKSSFIAERQYKIHVIVKDTVHGFTPFVSNESLVGENDLREWLAVKCINAEKAALQSVAFLPRAQRAANLILHDIVQRAMYTSNTLTPLRRMVARVTTSQFTGAIKRKVTPSTVSRASARSSISDTNSDPSEPSDKSENEKSDSDESDKKDSPSRSESTIFGERPAATTNKNFSNLAQLCSRVALELEQLESEELGPLIDSIVELAKQIGYSQSAIESVVVCTQNWTRVANLIRYRMLTIDDIAELVSVQSELRGSISRLLQSEIEQTGEN